MVKAIAIVNRKGGVGKSTLALGLAHVLSQRGRTALVDTDPETSAIEGLPDDSDVDAVPLAIEAVRPLFSNPEMQSYDFAVIDTPPNSAEAIDAAAAVADIVAIPMGASAVEFKRLGRTVARMNGTPWVVVPSRIRMSTMSGREVHDMCVAQGINVTRCAVPLREAIPLSYGGEPPVIYFSALADELVGMIG